jgi:hypothetical protein
MSEATFSQEFCTIVPSTAGGWLVAGERIRNCVVRVQDGDLFIGQVPGKLIAQVPAQTVQIMTPGALRKIGTAVSVRLSDGQLLSVDFGFAHLTQRNLNKHRGFLAQVFNFDSITQVRKGTRLGRQLCDQFRTALIHAGATDGRQ